MSLRALASGVLAGSLLSVAPNGHAFVRPLRGPAKTARLGAPLTAHTLLSPVLRGSQRLSPSKATSYGAGPFLVQRDQLSGAIRLLSGRFDTPQRRLQGFPAFVSHALAFVEAHA